MVDIDGATGVAMVGGTVARGQGDPTGDQRNEMVAADAVTRISVCFFEYQVAEGGGMNRMDGRGTPGGLGYLTSNT